MFVEMVYMHPGNSHIYLKAQDKKKTGNDATVKKASSLIHHLKQSAMKEYMTIILRLRCIRVIAQTLLLT
jgi:hypothetical protein